MIIGRRPRDLIEDLGRIALVAVVYFAAAKLGLAFAFVNRSVTAVWPPSGVALAAVLILGARVWPGVWLGAFLVNLTTQGSVLSVCGMATGNTIEALVGAFLLTRVGFRRDLTRLRDVIALVILAAGLSTLFSATIGVASLNADGLVGHGMLFSTWRVWWLGDLGGDVLAGSAILVLAARLRPPARRLWRAEGAAWLVVLAAVSWFVFSGGGLRAYATLPLLLLIALRFGQPGAVLGGVIVGGFAVGFTAHGHGPFVGGTRDAALLRAQTFVGIATVSALVVAAIRSEQRSSEEAAEEFRGLLDASPDGTLLVDQRGEIVLASAEAQRLFGVVDGALIGRAVETLIPSVAGARHRAHRAEYWRSPRVRPMGAGLDLSARRVDGSEFPVEIRLSPITLQRRPMVIAAIRDVSAHKAGEAALRRAEQRFRAAFELAPVGMTLIGARPENSGRYLAVNRAFAELLGFDQPADLVGRHYGEFSHPDEVPMLEASAAELMTEGYLRAERRYLRRDQRELWAEIHVALIRDAEGEPDHLVTQLLDLSERRQSEAELRQGAAIAGNLAEGVFMTRVSDRRMVYANSRCEQLFGYARDELVGSPASMLVAPADERRITDSIVRERRFSGEIQSVRADGVRVWCHANVSEFEHPDQGPVWITAVSNITERKRSQIALEAAVEIVRAIGAETQLERVLGVIAERSRALVDASGVAILLTEGDELQVAATAGSFPQKLLGKRVSAQASIADRARKSGTAQRVDLLGDASGFALKPLGVSATSALVVPLRFRQATFGVIEAFDRVAGPQFREEDERLLLAAAASAGIAVATAHSVERDRLRRTMQASEDERRRWARELHDETLQALGGLRVLLSSAERSADEHLLRQITRSALEQLDTEIESLRVLISELRPAALDELGLHAALLALAERTRSTHGIDVRTSIDSSRPSAIGPELETVIYRIVQEALTNAARHADPETIDVRLVHSDAEIRLAITDDGSGFDPSRPSEGFGLVGMRERVSLVGGRLRVSSSPGKTVIEAALPLLDGSVAAVKSGGRDADWRG